MDKDYKAYRKLKEVEALINIVHSQNEYLVKAVKAFNVINTKLDDIQTKVTTLYNKVIA
jgi:hypothetical protein